MSISKAPSLHIGDDIGRPATEYDDGYLRYPDWFKYIDMIREPVAEFFGTMVLIIFGVGVNCQAGLFMNTNVSQIQKGTELSVNFGWAVGVALGVWLASAVSAGHCNPALTIGLAVWRGFSWKKVPFYIVAQTLGAFVGTAIVYGNYIHAVDLFEGGKGVRTIASASFFSSYPLDFMTNVSSFFSELLATAIIFIVVLALGDKRHGPHPSGFVPLMIFVLVLGVGTSLGAETNYAVNPARDLGSRMLTALVGYGSDVFTFRGQYWLWCPIIAPILGCVVGGLVYDVCLFSSDPLPASLPPPSPPSAMPHKLKFETYRSDRTHSIRPDSRVYDLEQHAMSVNGAV